MINTLKILFISTIVVLSACSSEFDQRPIRVGTIAGPETQLMEVAQQVARDTYGLNINIVEFTDYASPNIALNDGSIDANAVQTLAYFEATLASTGYDLSTVGITFIYPMGIYAGKTTNLEALEEGATVAIPSDPSNEERALLLLEQAGLITLPADVNHHLTTRDIQTNPKNLRISTLEPAQLPRALADVDIAVINTNYAMLANLSPEHDALLSEGQDSPYVNIIAARTADKDKIELQQLVKAYQSQAVIDEAEKLFDGQAIPAWRLQDDDQVMRAAVIPY